MVTAEEKIEKIKVILRDIHEDGLTEAEYRIRKILQGSEIKTAPDQNKENSLAIIESILSERQNPIRITDCLDN